MASVEFRFAELHPDAPVLPSDLDWLLRFVAGNFEVLVGGTSIFDELEFPVLEFASVLDAWLGAGMVHGQALDYEVTGGTPGTLTIRPTRDGWVIDSAHRRPGTRVPAPVTGQEVRRAVSALIDDLASEIGRDYNYDVRGLLRRVNPTVPQ
jgi:hypothetical protein